MEKILNKNQFCFLQKNTPYLLNDSCTSACMSACVCVCVCVRVCMFAHGVIVIVVGNGHGDKSSNPR